jgi:plastocyanin
MRALRSFYALAVMVLVAVNPLVPAGAAAPAQLAQATPAAAAAVKIVNFDYGPNPLTVDVGTTVSWTNSSDRPHTVTDRGGTFDSQPILPGHLASVTFSAPGTYFYFCRINPSRMNGTIVVRSGGQPSRTVRVQAVDPGNIAGEHFRFEPNNLTVATGTTLLVANVGGKPHTFTADDASFDTGVITPGPEGGRFAGSNSVLTLSQPGTFGFHCNIHPALMRGTVTVVGPVASAAPAPASNGAQQGTVKVVDFAFSPTQLSVGPGARLTFRNTGQAPHTATFDDVSLDTGTISAGATGQLTAPLRPASYSYHCNIHPAKMRGVLVVLGQNVADPVALQPVSKPVAIVSGRGPGGRVSSLVLVTGVLGAFLGGLGIAPFLRKRRA